MRTLSIIIPVYNQWEFTSTCLLSLKQHTPEDIEVIVVDNASTDRTRDELDALGAQLWADAFQSFHCDTNEGFARACNIGAQMASSDTLFFLNNDTELTPGWLPPLLDALHSDQTLGAVGPLLLYPGSNLIQHLGIAFLPETQVEHLYEYFPATHPLATRQRYPKAVTAAAICMTRETFMQAGGFFEGYRNGCEDIDLCLTLGSQGRRFRCVPESVVFHHTSQTPGRFDHDQTNSALLLSRHERNMTPDLHLHASRDGYGIRLNDWLLASVCLTAEHSDELNREAHDAGPQALLDMLDREPLWEEGYDLLAGWFESRQSYREALHIRTLAAQFHPSRSRYIQLIKTAHKAGTPEMAAHAREKLEKIASDPAVLRRKAIRSVQWAKAAGEPFWEQLYLGWLSESGPSAGR